MPLEIPFDTWKRDYQPIIYEELGSYCYEHDGNWDGTVDCGCEYLRTWFLEELAPGGYDADEYGDALTGNRVWTWHSDGRITSGVNNPRANLLITQKPYERETEIV